MDEKDAKQYVMMFIAIWHLLVTLHPLKRYPVAHSLKMLTIDNASITQGYPVVKGHGLNTRHCFHRLHISLFYMVRDQG